MFIDWAHHIDCEGCMVAQGMECISGSWIQRIGTLMPCSHTKIFLSSPVVTSRLPSSKYVTVVTLSMWYVYVCTISPERASNCVARRSEAPTTNTSSSPGRKVTHDGVPLAAVW